MADYQVIDDPNDPRSADTPLNPTDGFDPQAFIKREDATPPTQEQQPQELPTFTPRKQTYYFPATPEETRAAGLSYSMEGGIHGSGKFSALDLRDHTKEKYDAGESPFVATAMYGVPTGAEFNMVADDGKLRVHKQVDTGGGLIPGQADVATSNPDLARGGGGFDPQSFIKREDLKAPQVPDIHAFMEPPPAEPSAAPEPAAPDFATALGQGIQAAAKAIGATGTKLNLPPVPQLPRAEIPQVGTQLPMIPTAPFPQAMPVPLPTPGPDYGQMNPYAEGIRLAFERMIPTSSEQAKQMVTLPRVSDVEEQMRQTEELGAQWRGERGPVAQAEAITGTVLQAAPLAKLPPVTEAAGVAARSLAGRNILPQMQEVGAVGYTGGGREVPVPEALQPKVPQYKAASVQGLKQPPVPADMINAVKLPTGKVVGYNIEHGDVLSRYSEQYAPHEMTSGWVLKRPTKVATDATFIGTDDVQRHAGDFDAAFREKAPPAPPTQPPTGGGAPAAPVPAESLNPVPDRGPFYRTYKIDKDLGEKMDAIGAAPEHGAILSEYSYDNITHELSPQQEADLTRLLVSDRLKLVNPDHPQIIFDSVARGIESDPAIKKALDYYRQEIEPEIEAIHKRAGTSEEAIATQRGQYITLIPERLPDGTIPQLVPRAARMSRTTRFAKAAEGEAAKYSTDLKEILRQAYTGAVRQAATRDLFNATEAKGLGNRVEDLPPALQHDLNLIAQRGNTVPAGGLQRFFQAYQRGATGVQLSLNPLEVQSHMRRQLHIVSAKPPVGMGLLSRLEVVIPYFGPKIGTFKRAMSDMSTPLHQQILKDIYGTGAGSTRAFGREYGIKKIPGLKEVSNFTDKLLFGIPKGKGVMGWHARMQVVLEEIRRNVEPTWAHDKQRQRQFGTQIGQYGTMRSWPVRALSHVNPYAGTTLEMRLSELKTLLGDAGFRGETLPRAALHRVETFLRGTGGTIAMLTLANKLLSGKYPWENAKGREFDLRTGFKDKDQNDIYIPNRFLSPEFYRAISTLSVPSLVREARSPRKDYASAAAIGPVNAVATMLNSPAFGITTAAIPQVAPYFMRDPGQHGMDLMKVGRISKREERQGIPPLLKRSEAVAEQVHPLLASILGYMEEPINGLKPLGVFSVDKRRGGGGYSQGIGRGSGGGSSGRGTGGR